MKIGSVVRAVVPGALVVLSLAAVGGQSPQATSPAPATAQDAAASPALPQWAYPAPSPGKDATVEKARAAAAHNEAPQHVPGSTKTFTTGYIADLFTVPDWFPNEHPPMPRPVREGRRPDAYA
ncbi:MAG: hypothetical protein ACLGSH_00815, partial [Acidobacteriota bacterium]